jgi:hypothetical protein
MMKKRRKSKPQLKMEDNKKENYVFKKIQELPMVTRRIKIR